MIDYSLTFTKKGRKPYLTLSHKEVCHIYSEDLKALTDNNLEN